MRAAVRTLLAGLGEDPSREGLLDTPKRVAKAVLDLTAGYHHSASSVLGSAFFHEPIVSAGNNGLVVVRDIDFAALAEATLLPFHGRAHVAYVPNCGVVLGLSKLARLTRVFAKRLTSQERLGRELAAALHRALQPQGVAVLLTATHLDMAAPIQPPARTTACVSGCLASDAGSLQELLLLLGLDDDICAMRSSGRLHALLATELGDGLGLLSSAPKPSPQQKLDEGGCGGSQPCEWPIPPVTPDPSDRLSERDTLSSDKGDSPSLVDLCGCGGCSCAAVCGCSSPEDGSSSDADGGVSEPVSEPGGPLPPAWPTLISPGAQDDVPAKRMTAQRPKPCCVDATMVSIHAARSPVSAGGGAEQQADRTGVCSAAAGLQQPCCSAESLSLSAVAVRPAAANAGMEEAVLQLFSGLDAEASHRLALQGSARRYVQALQHATAGYSAQLPEPIRQPIGAAFGDADGPGGGGEAWAASPCRCVCLPFTSQCEHHMLPFYGHIHVVYQHHHAGGEGASRAGTTQQPPVVPGDATPGPDHRTSVLPAPEEEEDAIQRVVDVYCRRLQVQERITHQVADGVLHVLGGAPAATSVLVVATGAHMCMVARGVENHAGQTTSMAIRGPAANDAAWRTRALQACRRDATLLRAPER